MWKADILQPKNLMQVMIKEKKKQDTEKFPGKIKVSY